MGGCDTVHIAANADVRHGLEHPRLELEYILAGYPGAVRCLTAEADDRGEPRAFRAHPGWTAERRQGFPGYGQAFLMRRSGGGVGLSER
jgi:hypothetical protein